MIIYPTASAIVDIHNSVIEKSGGLAGVKDIGQLESILHISKTLIIILHSLIK